jgi:hypothetical protein
MRFWRLYDDFFKSLDRWNAGKDPWDIYHRDYLARQMVAAIFSIAERKGVERIFQASTKFFDEFRKAVLKIL